MSVLAITYAVLLYAAVLVCVAGLTLRIGLWLRAPAPLKIPTTPAPTTPAGAAARVAREVFFFESLYVSNKWIWLFGWTFHAALMLVLLRHLRYFTEPVWWWVELAQPFGLYAAFAMALGLGGLWLRRVLVERIRWISVPSDHLMLALLAGITISGIAMGHLRHTDIVDVKAFTLGLMTFDLQPLPGDPALLVHLALVALLIAVFPASKLLHAAGVLFSPTRYQPDIRGA